MLPCKDCIAYAPDRESFAHQTKVTVTKTFPLATAQWTSETFGEVTGFRPLSRMPAASSWAAISTSNDHFKEKMSKIKNTDTQEVKMKKRRHSRTKHTEIEEKQREANKYKVNNRKQNITEKTVCQLG